MLLARQQLQHSQAFGATRWLAEQAITQHHYRVGRQHWQALRKWLQKKNPLRFLMGQALHALLHTFAWHSTLVDVGRQGFVWHTQLP
jgi:hypothetical protein